MDRSRSSALHEAAHCVVSELLGQAVVSVVALSTSGHTDIGPVPPEIRAGLEEREGTAVRWITDRVTITLAGRYGPALEGGAVLPINSELILSGWGWDEGKLGDVVHDVRYAAELLWRSDPAGEVRQLDRLGDRARELVERHAAEIKALADALVIHGRLTGTEVRQILSSTDGGAQ